MLNKNKLSYYVILIFLLRNPHEISSITKVAFLFVFKAWKQTLGWYVIVQCKRNCQEDGQKSKLVIKIIFCPLQKYIELSTMETIPRGFKLRTVIDRFAWDLLLILRETFIADSFDSEHVKLQILMTLSDVMEKTRKTDSEITFATQQKTYRSSYVKNLLFRDFSATKDSIWHTFHLPATNLNHAQTIRIHDEAITYLSSVLERRLTLAQNLKEKPTSLHLLFTCFSKHSSLHSDWSSAEAFRHQDCHPTHTDRSYFSASAKKLADHCSQLGINYGEISHRRREQYGSLWLRVGDCKTELPEELSLFNVFNVLPLALNAEFFNDSLLQKSLIRVLDSLNERYKSLRSAGLSPQIWLERSEPSIAVLRDLKQLRTEADAYLKSGHADTLNIAFRMAFNEKRVSEEKKKVAGCHSFDEFSQTEYGQTMLKYSALSLDQSNSNGSEEELSLYDAIPGSDFEENMMQSIFAKFDDDFDWVQYLIDSRPELFDEVTTMFFQQVIAMDYPVDGELDDQPLLKNQKFKDLINANPYYKNLNTDNLAEQLILKANKIIDQGICLSENNT